ncbi:hypothetical protein MRB53_041381 [Persea americana]|nr:hypothetical protein MRB53_041381 [Persea americana]
MPDTLPASKRDEATKHILSYARPAARYSDRQTPDRCSQGHEVHPRRVKRLLRSIFLVTSPDPSSLKLQSCAPQTPSREVSATTAAVRGTEREADFQRGPRTPESLVHSSSASKRRKSRPSRHVLDPFNFGPPSFDASLPSSPLFFSPRPNPRPLLPARFSSSEVAANMLSTAQGEEPSVKTVTLACGKPAHNSSSQRPTLSNRSSVERHSTATKERPEEERPDGILSKVGITELLEQDDRQRLLSTWETRPTIRRIRCTSCLRIRPCAPFPGLYDSLVSENAAFEAADPPLSGSMPQFKSWFLGAAVDGESLEVCLPAFVQAPFSWSCSTLRKRLRIISGTLLPVEDDGPPSSVATVTISDPIRPQLHLPDHGQTSRNNHTLAHTRSVSSERMEIPESPVHNSPRSIASTAVSTTLAHNLELEHAATQDTGFFDWTRLPISDSLPSHIKFARSVDWGATSLGPIENWNADLRQMCNLIMASPHPAAMYWGEDLVAIYNEAYVLLAGQKHPKLMDSEEDCGNDVCSPFVRSANAPAAARNIKGFWDEVLAALDSNEYDTPFVLLYSISDDQGSDEKLFDTFS